MAKNLAWQILVVSIALAAAAAAGCASEEEGKMGKTQTATISVTSTAFKEGGTIPKEYTADGENVSPPLAWKDLPEEAAAIALLCEDPDAPKGMFVHWVIFNVDPKSGGLPRAVPKTDTLPDGAAQGKNNFNKTGYDGPSPPKGRPHRYFFRVYALNQKLDLKPGVTRDAVRKAMEGHILAEGSLMGKYGR